MLKTDEIEAKLSRISVLMTKSIFVRLTGKNLMIKLLLVIKL